jgi:two-component system cell cycle response regulator DivK
LSSSEINDERVKMAEGGKTVLVVEDDADIRALLKMVLESDGYQVVEATSGREAVSAAAALRPDLVLMDISLPLLDGLSATREIKADEATRGVPVVAVSAYHSARRRAIQAGCSELVGKPVDTEELLRVARELTSR